MFGLSQREHKFFRFFVIGHLLLGVGLVIFSFLPSCEKEPEDIHVFELASASPQPVEVKAPPPIQKPPQKREITKPVPPVKPTPKPKPITPAKPKPKPKPVTPKPKPTPVVEQTPKPQPISFEQFRKDRKLPSPVKPRPQVQTVKPIKLNPSDFSLPQIKVTSTSSSTPTVSASAVNQYLARVKAKMEGIWRELLSESALREGGEARLSFRISQNGSLISPRLSKSSGNGSLDRLVLEVAQRAGVFGPPPGGRLDSVLEIPFRVQ